MIIQPVIFVSNVDQAFLPWFLRCFYRVWEDITEEPIIAFTGHDISGVIKSSDIRCITNYWGQSASIATDVLKSLLGAKTANPRATHFLKLDVDVIHWRRRWFDRAKNHPEFETAWQIGVDSYNGKNGDRLWPWNCGAAYVLKADALSLVNSQFLCRSEDRAMTQAIDEYGDPVVSIFNHNHLTGATALDFKHVKASNKYDMIHCGEFGKSPGARRKAAQWMKRSVNLHLTL